MPIGDRPCPQCGARCFPGEQTCEECGRELLWERSELVQDTSADLPFDPLYIKVIERKRLLGVVGSLVLFVGVFTPIVSLPMGGSLNYFQNGRGDGTIVLVLAVFSLLLTLSKTFGGLWFTGLATLGLLLFAFVNLQMKISEAKVQMESQLSGNPFRGLADMAVRSIQIEWGWAVMFIGAGLLIAAAATAKPAPYLEAKQ